MKIKVILYFLGSCIIVCGALRGDAPSTTPTTTTTSETQLSGVAIAPVEKAGIAAPIDPLKASKTTVDTRDPEIKKRDMPTDIDERTSGEQEAKSRSEDVASI